MLQSIRDRSQGWFTWIIISLICITFAFWGIHNYMTGSPATNAVAKVNGIKITRKSVAQAYRHLRDQQQAMFGRFFPLDDKTQQQLKQAALQQLITTEALLQRAHKDGFNVSKAQADSIITRLPEFQEAGKFSEQRFLQILANMGVTPQQFERQIADELVLTQVRLGIERSEFALKNETSRIIKLLDQSRDFSYVIIPADSVTAEVSEEQLQDFYQQHQQQYQSPERVSIQYVELSADELAKNITISDQEIAQYYKQHKDKFNTPERWQVETLQFSRPKVADIDFSDEAKAEFAKDHQQQSDWLAQHKNYQRNGPQWFTKQQAIATYGNEISSLKPGSVSATVVTHQGPALVKLLKIQPADEQSLVDAAPQIKQLLANTKAEKLFAEQVDVMSNLSYEHPNDLNEVSRALGLSTKQSEPFSRDGGTDEVTQHSEVITAAFSQDVVQSKFNSEVINLTPTKAVVLRLVNHFPSKVQDFTEVKQQIQEQIAEQQRQQQLNQLADKISAQGTSRQNLSKAAKAHKLHVETKTNVRRDDTGFDEQILNAAFRLPRPQGKLYPVDVVTLNNGSVAVVAVDQVNDIDSHETPSKLRQNVIAEEISHDYAKINYELYNKSVLDNATIKQFAEQMNEVE